VLETRGIRSPPFGVYQVPSFSIKISFNRSCRLRGNFFLFAKRVFFPKRYDWWTLAIHLYRNHSLLRASHVFSHHRNPYWISGFDLQFFMRLLLPLQDFFSQSVSPNR
jgi:hypothetical protein